jgi:phenylacetate-coenzyme A ligase PaaK-like adenylate-forming protein
MSAEWNHKVFNTRKEDFEAIALETFRFQYRHNLIYRDFTDALHVNPLTVSSTRQVPFIPISLYKTHEIATGEFEPAVIFESSGTTGTEPSRHLVRDLDVYTGSFTRGFELFYGPVRDWCILGLLPGYLERKNSSLVYMVNQLIIGSGHEKSGFYLRDHEKLADVLRELERKKQKTLLIGVSFALLDFAAAFPIPLEHTTIMETGGMKGRREELLRAELHALLRDAFGIKNIHSEYGMTELLSQAYSRGEGIFWTPPWMKVMVRDEEDPLQVRDTGSGAINVIDLANIWSCSFIATDDAGKIHADGGFEVLGRLDGSDLRGCGLMVV